MVTATKDKRQLYREQGWWGDTTLADMFRANAGIHPERLALADDVLINTGPRKDIADLAEEYGVTDIPDFDAERSPKIYSRVLPKP